MFGKNGQSRNVNTMEYCRKGGMMKLWKLVDNKAVSAPYYRQEFEFRKDDNRKMYYRKGDFDKIGNEG